MTRVEWRKLENVRPFIDRFVRLESGENVTERLRSALPAPEKMAGAIVRLTVDYPRDFEKLIDETELRNHASGAFEFHLVKRPQMDARVRLPAGETIASLTPQELLGVFWNGQKLDEAEVGELQKLAGQILSEESAGGV